MDDDSDTGGLSGAAREGSRSGGIDTPSDVDRRRFLRYAGSVGGALALTHVLDAGRVLDPPSGTVTVETARVHPDGERTSAGLERRTRTVPADWHARVSAAFDLHADLARTKIPGYLNSAVVPGSYNEGTARISIGVQTDDLGAVPRTLADLVSHLDVEWRGPFEGVDVVVENTDSLDGPERYRPHLDAYLAQSPSVDPVPGGVRCEIDRTIATLTPALYHPDRSRPLFGTALHAFSRQESVRGTGIGLPTADDETVSIGYVTDSVPDGDVAIAEPIRGKTPGSAIGRNGELPIQGQLTRWGLADRVARGTDLLKVGGTTGYTAGPIHGVDAATCITTDRCRRGQVTWGAEADIGDGDSGSVAVDPDPDEVDGALVASLNSARTWWPGQDHIWGAAAYTLTESHDYHF